MLRQNGRGRLCFKSRVLKLDSVYDELVLRDALMLWRHMSEQVAQDVDLHFMHMLQHDPCHPEWSESHVTEFQKKNEI